MKQKDFANYAALLEEILDIGTIKIAPQSQLISLYSGKSLTGADIVLLIGNNSIISTATGSLTE